MYRDTLKAVECMAPRDLRTGLECLGLYIMLRPAPEMFTIFNKFNKFDTFTIFAKWAKCANFDPEYSLQARV